MKSSLMIKLSQIQNWILYNILLNSRIMNQLFFKQILKLKNNKLIKVCLKTIIWMWSAISI